MPPSPVPESEVSGSGAGCRRVTPEEMGGRSLIKGFLLGQDRGGWVSVVGADVGEEQGQVQGLVPVGKGGWSRWVP